MYVSIDTNQSTTVARVPARHIRGYGTEPVPGTDVGGQPAIVLSIAPRRRRNRRVIASWDRIGRRLFVAGRVIVAPTNALKEIEVAIAWAEHDSKAGSAP